VLREGREKKRGSNSESTRRREEKWDGCGQTHFESSPSKAAPPPFTGKPAASAREPPSELPIVSRFADGVAASRTR